jgi:hypothetical protein
MTHADHMANVGVGHSQIELYNRILSQLSPSIAGWIAAPAVYLELDRKIDPPPHLSLVAETAEAAIRSLRPFSGTGLGIVDEYLFSRMTNNHARVLDPIITRVAEEGDTQLRLLRKGRIGVHLLPSVVRRASRTSRELRAIVARSPFANSQLRTHRAVMNGAAEYERLTALLRSSHVRAVVTASQQHWSARALIAAARAAGVPSFYVPHAPTALTVGYTDLPTDIALLRGPADVDTYVRLGALEERLLSVGDPSATALEKGSEPKHSIVFATSTWPTEWLLEQVALIDRAIPGRRVVVAPHPRADLAWLRENCPSNWTIAPPGATQKLLTEGCETVITAGSGAGLEAAMAGARVLNVSSRPEYIQYVFHRSDACVHVTTSADLRAGLLRPRDVGTRDGTVWTAFRGDEAARVAANAIDRESKRNWNDAGANDIWRSLWPLSDYG